MAEVDLPKLLAGEIKRERTRFAEEDIDALAVGDGRIARIPVFPKIAAVRIFRQLGDVFSLFRRKYFA